MHILLVTPYYSPDLGPSAPLIAALAETLVANFDHSLTVVCAAPHFPDGLVQVDFRHWPWKWADENGVRICRVWVPSGDRARLTHRLLVFIVYQAFSALAVLWEKYDVVILTNPAIETGFLFWIFAWLKRKPSIYCVWDLYPESIEQAGITRNKILLKIVEAMENFCIRHAMAVQALSRSFLSNLQGRVKDSKRVVHIPLWLSTNDLHSVPRQNSFSREYALDDKFVVMYAGNIGLSQGLEKIVYCAREIISDRRIQFVFVGDGKTNASLRQLAHDLELANIIFLPFQPRERLGEVLSSADLLLVSLEEGAGGTSIPSKTLPIMACERPILAIVDEGSELWELIINVCAGWVLSSSARPDELASLIKKISKEDKIKEYGMNAGRYVREHLSLNSAAEAFHSLINGVTG